MKEDEILEFTFRSIRKKKRRTGCPECGTITVSPNGQTYICGYSSSSKGVTPCDHAELQQELDNSFIAELKDQFKNHRTQVEAKKEEVDTFFEQLKKMD